MSIKYIYDNPELYAQDILLSLQLTPPIDVFKICETYDLNVNYENISSAEALLIISKQKKNIIINDRKISYKPRQRFTIAHEIGHFFIPWHANVYECSNVGNFCSDNTEENEADIFASELLIPSNILFPITNNKTINLELIMELAREFNVSLTAMARKVILNTQQKVIVLFYYNNGTKFVQAQSEGFDFILKPGVILGSAAKELLQNRSSNGNEIVKKTLRSNVWFSENVMECEVVEESLNQPNFNRVFTLLRIANDFDYYSQLF